MLLIQYLDIAMYLHNTFLFTLFIRRVARLVFPCRLQSMLIDRSSLLQAYLSWIARVLAVYRVKEEYIVSPYFWLSQQ